MAEKIVLIPTRTTVIATDDARTLSAYVASETTDLRIAIARVQAWINASVPTSTAWIIGVGPLADRPDAKIEYANGVYIVREANTGDQVQICVMDADGGWGWAGMASGSP
jgi:hypothetical protein